MNVAAAGIALQGDALSTPSVYRIPPPSSNSAACWSQRGIGNL